VPAFAHQGAFRLERENPTWVIIAPIIALEVKTPRCVPTNSAARLVVISKFRKKDKPPDPDIVLKKVKEKAQELKLCTKRRANRTIEDTFTIVQQAELEIRALGWGMSKLAVIGHDVHQGIASVDENVTTVRGSIGQMNKSLGDIGSTVDGVDRTTRRVESKMDYVDSSLVLLKTEMKESKDELKRILERTLMNDSLTAKNRLVELLEERRRSKLTRHQAATQPCHPLSDAAARTADKALILEQSSEIQRLKEKLQHQRGASVQTASSMHLLSCHELLAAVAHAAADSVGATDVESLLLQANDDLIFIAARREEFDGRSIGQANSILRSPRFLDWMQNSDSDLVLVDGNIPSTASANISALSLFCSTFVASLARLYPQDIVVSFFCGCHTGLTDPWYGPVGLVRSLLTQVLMALIERGEDSVQLETAEEYLDHLGSANLEILCEIFEKVIAGLPQGISVTCVIDNVSSFDRDFRGLFGDMKRVIHSLAAAAGRDAGAACKVLLTNSARSTSRLSSLVLPSQHSVLTPDMLGPRTISDRSMEANIARSRSVTPDNSGVPVIDEWD